MTHWHEMTETTHYRRSPDGREFWWVELQMDLLVGVGWYWFITGASRLDGVKYHNGYRFDTWQDAAKDCEERGGSQ